MSNRFEQIYATNEWGGGSGEGSFPIHTRGYVDFLQRFLAQRRVTSVVDMGCGDWQFSRSIQWGNINYRGYDVVRSVIEENCRKYSAPNISFHLYSGNAAELPPADLLISKDVLQHLSDESVARVLPSLSRFKYSLLTNCVNPRGTTIPSDIADGDFRYLDLRLPPFNLAATEVFSFTNSMNAIERFFKGPRWSKRVLLVEGGA
jgi:2-polyprenyl-3-methyl-5-hydroxy-6-metoxy-1,4-benzoquinol methylase